MKFARFTLSCAALIFACVVGSATAADLRKATLQPTYTLDLESGSVGGLGPTVDLFWQAKTRSDRCLGPMFNSRALLAPLTAGDFEKADAAKLMALPYENRCFSHTNSGGELKKGTTFAVRTVEGNFAKVRVRDIGWRNEIELEWQVFVQAPSAKAAQKPSGNPALDIQNLFEQARTALRSRKPADAVPSLEQALELAQKLPPASAQRINALSEAGNLLWSTRRFDLAERALLAATRDIEAAPNAAPLDAVRTTYRMLGIVYRDGRKSGESVSWFERSIKVAGTMPESTPNDKDGKYWHISSDAGELAAAHCGTGNTAAAAAAEKQRLEACGRIRKPEYYGSCKAVTARACENGWMR